MRRKAKRRPPKNVPNGFTGSQEDWVCLEAPLQGIDEALSAFARSAGLTVTSNYHNWPSRSLQWSSHGLSRLIQIYLTKPETGTYDLWICASEDREHGRFWKQKHLRSAARLEDIKADLADLLREAYETVEAWKSNELEFATPLKKPASR